MRPVYQSRFKAIPIYQAFEGMLLRREGSPQKVADAVAFLLGNDFVTGICLPVDGGRTIFSGSFER